jgi:hypothetical protein
VHDHDPVGYQDQRVKGILPMVDFLTEFASYSFLNVAAVSSP